MTLGLGDNVEAHQVAPGLQQAPGDGADGAVADGQAVELCGRHDAVGGAGEEGLVGGVDIVGLEVGGLGGDIQVGGQLEDGLAGDTGEGAAGVGRLKNAVGPDEEVAALVFGYVAIGIQI